ncbi:MAG: hypothetical protein GX890_08700 [Firmicutes bacterium]|jgi:uncharacterized protein YkwD|nr:hypothetical protein [Bacillota bacterium]HPU00966.1 CAP domain-containing protein [Bacillota bacterium]
MKRSRLSIYLLLALLILLLAFPAAAGAYAARSSGGTIPGYGIARSSGQVQWSSGGSSGWLQPSTPSKPPAPPVQPPEPATPEEPEEPETPATPPPGEAVELNPQERELFDLVNRERVSRGLAPLQLDARLTYLARLKSQDMADRNYFAHQSPTYGSSGDMLRNAGYKFSLAAENIGMGGSIKAIFNAFMNSSGHRNKIVSSRYTHTGVGVVYKPGRGYLVTQLFVKPR